MPLKSAKGNMYPWVTHTHSHLGGECSHKCIYCYVDNPINGRPERYCGPLRIIEHELRVPYGKRKTIFMEHMNDLFAADVPNTMIAKVIRHAQEYPDNIYVWQTKNPARFLTIESELGMPFPKGSIFGTTIETNRDIPDVGKAPRPAERAAAMEFMNGRKFITIEPVLDFDVDILADWIVRINPEFLNLGADSKNHNLDEPTVEKIMNFVDVLHKSGIELREKHNLNRLKEK